MLDPSAPENSTTVRESDSEIDAGEDRRPEPRNVARRAAHHDPARRANHRGRTSLRLARAALQTAYVVSEQLGTSLAERLFITPRRHTRPERERVVLATGRELAIDITLRSPRWHGARRTLAAWRWGFGPTVLLVHGWEGRGSQLGAFVQPLVDAGMSVVAFDAPGHGDSPDHTLYLTDLADAIADVAAAVGPVQALVAHSFGAAAALLAHARGNLAVTRNVMISPNAIVDDAVVRFARMVGLDDSDRIALERRLAEHTGLTLESLALERLVAGCDAALLVVHDRDDREVPFAHGERLAAAWPNAQLRETTGLGHRRILRDADTIAAVVEHACFGVSPPRSDLVREVDRLVGGAR